MPEAMIAPPIVLPSIATRSGASLPVLLVAAFTLAVIPVVKLLSSWWPAFPAVIWQIVSGLDSLLPVYLAFGTGALIQRLGWFALGVAALLTTVALMCFALEGSWEFLGWPLQPCIVWFSAFPLAISWLFLPVRLLTGPIARSNEGGRRFQFRMLDLFVITAVAAATLSLARSLGVDLVGWSHLRNMLLCTGYTLLPVLFAAGSRLWHFALGVALFLPALWLSVDKNRGVINQELIVANLAFMLVIYLPLLALRLVGYRFQATIGGDPRSARVSAETRSARVS